MKKWNYPIGTVGYMGGVYAVPEPFCWSWGALCTFTERTLPGCYYNRATNSLHDSARGFLVDHMQGDWLVMFDTDHIFRPDVVLRLVHRAYEYGLDVVTGLYQTKTWPHTPLIYQWAEEDKGIKPIVNWNRDFPLFQVDAAGGGCLLVRRSVFSRIIQELKERPFDRFGEWGEDLAFFQRCKRLGISCFVDTRIRAHHLQQRGVDLDDMDTTVLKENDEKRCQAVYTNR